MRLLLQRIGYGLAAMGALVWVLWPTDGWSLEPEAGLAFIIATAVWIWRECTPSEQARSESRANLAASSALGATASHPNDLTVAKSFLDFFTPKMQDFLRFHDLGGSFAYSLQSKIFDAVGRWEGADWEYEEPELQASFRWFVELLTVFANRLSIHFEPLSEHRVRMIASPEERFTDLFSEETMQRMHRYNALSSSVYDRGEEHLRLLRKKLPAMFAGRASDVRLAQQEA